MLGQQWLRYAVAVCLCFVSFSLYAGYPVVGRSTGTLAVQVARDAEWQVIPVGGIVPDAAEARTSAPGASHLHADQGFLAIGPLSQIKYDLTARRVDLLSGRVFCKPQGEQPWTIQANTYQVVIAPHSEIDVTLPGRDRITVIALSGSAELRGVDDSGKSAAVVSAKQIVTAARGNALVETKPLDTVAEIDLKRWTKQAPPGQGVGQLVIKNAQGGDFGRLNIARYHAEVVLQPPVALVKLDQSFYNPRGIQAEGEFIFNLPPGASVSRFAMFVTKDQLIEGEVIERQRADFVYNTIVHTRRDPAILEQIGDNLFKMRVFPIFPHDVKRILLDFTLPLDGRSGQYQMQLPLLSNLLPIWDFRVFGSIRGSTPLASVQFPTLTNVKVESRGPDDIQFDFVRTNYQPTADFLVSFQQPTPATATKFRRLEAEPLLLIDANKHIADKPSNDPFGVIKPKLTPQSAADNSANPLRDGVLTYFQADLPVPKLAAQDSPADILVLVDTSRSMSRDRLSSALQTTLANLRPADRFRLAAADVVTRPLHKDWAVPNSNEAAAALRQFDQQIYLASTDLLATCKAVPELYANSDPARRRMVIYLGGTDSMSVDTAPSLAKRCAAEIAKANATFSAINVVPSDPPLPRPRGSGGSPGWNGASMGMGGAFFQLSAVNTPNAQPTAVQQTLNNIDGKSLLSLLANESGGRYFDFTSTPAERGRLFEWLLSGVPTPARVEQITVTNCFPTNLYYPKTLLPGESLRVTGVMRGQVKSLDVTWQIKSAENTPVTGQATLIPEQQTQDHLVGRYWAHHKIRELQSALASVPNHAEARAAIVELSREWSLLTPQTAFLVLETEADYLRWQVPRQARRRYWSDRDLRPVQPLADQWLAKVDPGRNGGNPDVNVKDFDTSAEILNALDEARHAVQAGQLERARSLLKDLNQDAVAKSTQEFQTLQKLTDVLGRQSRAMQNLGTKRAWFSLGQTLPSLPAGLDRLLVATSPITTNVLDRHPQAEVLLKEMSLFNGKMSLVEFAQFLKERLGVNVTIDSVKLEEESVDINKPFELPRLKNVSAMNAIYHCLNLHNLTAIEEPRRLLITTKTDASDHRPNVLFPVRDLLVPNPKFDFEDLQDPLFDRDEAVRQRIKSKLEKTVSWRLKDASLKQVMERLRTELDENVLVDAIKLDEESVAVDSNDINCDYQNVQLGEALRWVLDQKNLTTIYTHEALAITTKSEGGVHRPVRVYSGQGILFRDTQAMPPPDQNRFPQNWNGGPSMGMGGFGGGFGFTGGMGGMGGGMGGMVGGMGGMGGGGFGGPVNRGVDGEVAVPTNSAQPTSNQSGNQSGVSDEGTEPQQPATVDDEVEDSIGGDNSRPFGTPGPGGDTGPVNLGATLQSIQRQTGGPPDSPWMNEDGEGGAIGYFAPSLAIVLRQTEETHAEISDFFEHQRALLAKRGLNPNMVAMSAHDATSRPERDVYSLMSLLHQTTGGPPDSPWMIEDGEGGSITYERPTMSLAIRQTTHALDEIAGLLVQLRRERYSLIHQYRPWENSLFTDRQPGLFSGPWLNSTPAAPPIGAAATETELAALKVRRELPAGHWKLSDELQGKSFDFDLQAGGDKLALTWPGWQLRVQGTTCSVAMPDLQYAEIGNWGQGLRDWLDIQLVFWPHRSNQELAKIFQIAPAQKKDDPPQHTRLRLTPRDVAPNTMWLEVTYDRDTGLPVVWEAYRRQNLIRRYRFSTEKTNDQITKLIVRHETATGQELAQGEWLMATPQAIPDAEDLSAGTLVIDRRPQTRAFLNSFEAGVQHFRLGEFQKAAEAFKQAKADRPDHPLVSFLFAWSLDHQPGEVDRELLRTAYLDTVRVAPPQLLALLTQYTSRTLSDRDLYEILATRPDEKRTIQDEIDLAKFAIRAKLPRAANSQAMIAWKRHPTTQQELLETARIIVESHIRLGEVNAALTFYHDLDKQSTAPGQLVSLSPILFQLLLTFERFQQGSRIKDQYAELLKRNDAGITPDMRHSLLRRYADTVTREHRWATLLEAIDTLPENSPEALSEMEGLLSELRQHAVGKQIGALVPKATHDRYRRMLIAEQADWTDNLKLASDMYWQLYQEGYSFERRTPHVCERLLAAHQPERAVAILEDYYRSNQPVGSGERLTLAKAYEQSNRPLDAHRVLSDGR